MRVTIESDIVLSVEASADVSSDENAGGLIVTITLWDSNGFRSVNITSNLSDNDKGLLLASIEDKYRDLKNAEKDFGKGA